MSIVPKDDFKYFGIWRLAAQGANDYFLLRDPSHASNAGGTTTGLFPADYYNNEGNKTYDADFTWNAPRAGFYRITWTPHNWIGTTAGRVLMRYTTTGGDIEAYEIAANSANALFAQGFSITTVLKLPSGGECTPFLHAASAKYPQYVNFSVVYV